MTGFVECLFKVKPSRTVMIDGHVYIDVKTSITTSGSHNGIIVQSGIHQGPDMMFWPCTLNGAPTSFASQQLPVATTPAAIQWPHTQEDGTDGGTEAASERHNVAGKRTLPRPPSPVYSFSGADDEPPDNFIDSGNIRLNVFEPEGIVTEPASSGSEMMPSSNAGYYSDLEGTGAASRTPGNRATIARKPLSTMRNPNYDREQWPEDNMAATSTNIPPDVNMRTKPLPVPRRRNSITRTYSNITPNQESYKTIATDYRQYNGNSNDAGAPNYDYNQIEKEFSRSPPLGKMPRIMANPRKSYGSGENLPITAPGISQHESSRQLAGPLHNFSWNQQQHYKSTPDLRVPPPAYSAVQKSNRPDSALLEMDEPKKVPEQMFHLYQTKDAFGNLLAQCEMEIETDDQLMSRLSLNASEKLHNQNVSDNRNFAENLGLPLISDDSVTHPEDDSRKKIPITGFPKFSDFSGAHPQVQQDFIDMTYNADALRNACSSLYGRPVTRIPMLKKIPPREVPESTDFGYSKPDSANEIKASRVIPDAEIGSEYFKDERSTFERAVEKYATFPTSKINQVIPFADQEERTVAEKNPVEMMPEKVGNLEKAVGYSKNSGNIPEKETKVEKPVGSNISGTVPQTTGGNPTKSILHSSARKSSLRKKVRFPPEKPQVIAVDHRLLVDDIPDLV